MVTFCIQVSVFVLSEVKKNYSEIEWGTIVLTSSFFFFTFSFELFFPLIINIPSSEPAGDIFQEKKIYH